MKIYEGLLYSLVVYVIYAQQQIGEAERDWKVVISDEYI
jgi:hypothetical protein